MANNPKAWTIPGILLVQIVEPVTKKRRRPPRPLARVSLLYALCLALIYCCLRLWMEGTAA